MLLVVISCDNVLCIEVVFFCLRSRENVYVIIGYTYVEYLSL